MHVTCDIAFKEWAAVCAALAAGRQALILRKGGIQEGPRGFQPEHERFWLYSTNFHQGGEGLTQEGAAYLQSALLSQPQAGRIRLQQLAVVEDVRELKTETAALALEGLHIWSQDTVRQRFHYRRPGLFVLLTRIYANAESLEIEEHAEFAGCKTWVQLPAALTLEADRPVVTDHEWALVSEKVRGAIG